MNELIPLQPQTINGNAVETVSARTLHEFLEVGRDFSNWIKNRIEKYGFIHPAVKPPLLRGGYKAVHSGVACSSIYWRNTSILAPPQLPAK